MRILPLLTSGAVAVASLAIVGASAPAAHAAPSYRAYALSGSTLLSLDIAKPSVVSSTTLTGVTAGETLVGLDVRPANGELYSVGVNATADTATLYVVHEQTGVVSPVGSITLTTDGTMPVDYPDPATVDYDVDVNPAVDRIRLVGGSVNLRVNPNTAQGLDGNNGAAGGNGINPDGAPNGGTTSVGGAGYTNNVPDSGGITSLYTLDAGTNGLFLQNPPNSGTQTLGQSLTIEGFPLDFSSVGGFDIPSGVDAPTSNAPVNSGAGYAALVVGGITRLYTIDLATGAAHVIGVVGSGTARLRGLALQRAPAEGHPVIGLDHSGTNIVRFSTATPGTTTTQPVGGVIVGEVLAAVAWRPATGQLLGLGVNSTADTATLYRVDPQTGAAGVIGGFGLLAWTDSGGGTIDLPNPANTAYAMDISAVTDRVRLTTGAGLNARAVPATGAPVDADGNGANGVQPDGGPGVALNALTYTSPYAGATSTTVYALDATFNQLSIMNPPNAGNLVDAKPVTVNGATLDFSTFGGLDALQDAPTAYAVLTVGGQAGLYRLDLATARATPAGGLLGGLRSIAVGQAGAARPVPPAPAPRPATLKRVAAARQVHRRVDTGRVLTCPSGFRAASCATTVRLVATYKIRKKTTRVVVGAATVRTSRGKASRLTVALSSKGVRLLKQRRTLQARAAIVAPTGPAGAARTTTVAVTLRKKRL